MRTEVKIGIIVGLIVVVVLVVFFVRQGKQAGGDVATVVPMDKNKMPATGEKAGVGKGSPATPTRSPSGSPGTAGRPTGAPGAPPPGGGQSPAFLPRLTGERSPTGGATSLPVEKPGIAERAGATPATQAVLPPPGGIAGATTRPTEPTPGGAAATGRREPGVAVPPPPDTAKPGPGESAVRPSDVKPAAKPAQKRTVDAGESFWSIAAEVYGDGHLYTKLQEANPELAKRGLHVGDVLVIPPKEEVVAPAGGAKAGTVKPDATKPGAAKTDATKPGAAKSPTTKPAAGKPSPAAETKPKARQHTYVVEKGDTLMSIARNILKDERRWREIYDLNKSKISNPDVLPAGVELQLPEK